MRAARAERRMQRRRASRGAYIRGIEPRVTIVRFVKLLDSRKQHVENMSGLLGDVERPLVAVGLLELRSQRPHLRLRRVRCMRRVTASIPTWHTPRSTLRDHARRSGD
jgi:hypothetical protein